MTLYFCISFTPTPTMNNDNTIMGRYISTGIIFQYCFSKKEIEQEYERHFRKKKTFSELKPEIILQLFPEIYNHEEDEYYLYVYLADSVKSEDLVTTMKAYHSLVGSSQRKSDEIEKVYEKINGKTPHEAYKIAKERASYLFYDSKLGFSYDYYACPLVFEGEKQFYSVHLSIITIDASSAKTSTEDDLLSYPFFTSLLRYRMKPDKLADTMIIFLSP